MTHESFKDIVTFYEPMKREFVNRFLDKIIEDPLLEKWFGIWKTGDNRKIFDEIETLNEMYFAEKKVNQPLRAPKDATIPRRIDNNNVRK